jgi:hypothetical protein
MSLRKNLLVVFLCLLMVPFLTAQVTRQNGVIKGEVVDKDGVALPGVTVSATSPVLMGVVTSITSEAGLYRLLNLPPGVYTIMAALTGFKTVKQEGIVVASGQTYTVNLATEMTQLAEEITVVGAPPTVDLQSNKLSSIVSTELLRSLPLNRNIANLFNITAGAAGTIAAYSGSIHGANPGSTAYEIDGVNGESPTTGGMQIRPQFESVEEIEITTGGLPAQVGGSGGSFISVVTKSGGNQFHGQGQAYYTAKDLNQMLYTDEEFASFRRSKPGFAKYDYDFSGSLGGPIIKDKLWFYATVEYAQNEYTFTFDPVTIEGKAYGLYPIPSKNFAPFLKLTTQLNKDMRLFFMFNGAYGKRTYSYGYNTCEDARWMSVSNASALTGELNWTLGPNTVVAFRGAANVFHWPLVRPDESNTAIAKYDQYTGYAWSAHENEDLYQIRNSYSGSARLTHFMDGVLGGNHEIGAGVEYLYYFDKLTVAVGNPLTMYYWDGNPYIHQAWGDDRATYGDGIIKLGAYGPNEGDSTKDLPGDRLSAYVQDSFTLLNNRLTVNLGLRFDAYRGWIGGGTTTGTDPSGLAYKVGEQVAEHINWNPYGPNSWPELKDVFAANTLSPRIGVSYDLFGDGKTAVKASWGRFYEAVPVMWYCYAQPNIQAAYQFNWWDNNGNGVCDDPGIDAYEPRDGYWSFWENDMESLYFNVAHKDDQYQLVPPDNTELILSISHELARNFSVKLQYVNTRGYHGHWDSWYDRVTGAYIDSLEDAPAGFWVPFHTIIPAVGDWPETAVTVYYPTNDYNWDNITTRQCSSPYSKRIYNGVELTFDKRYADGWALGGSVTYSTLKSQGYYSVNYFTNGWGYDINDIPLAVKLYGTFKMPWGFVGSFIYRHYEGGPIGGGGNFWDTPFDVTVLAPADWMAEHNIATWYSDYWYAGVRIQPTGTHRNASWDNVDFRIEKEFKFGFGTVAVFADVFNLLGNKYVNVGLNPGGAWYPDAEYTTSGTRELDYYYGRITSLSGLRTYKISARITF